VVWVVNDCCEPEVGAVVVKNKAAISWQSQERGGYRMWHVAVASFCC